MALGPQFARLAPAAERKRRLGFFFEIGLAVQMATVNGPAGRVGAGRPRVWALRPGVSAAAGRLGVAPGAG